MTQLHLSSLVLRTVLVLGRVLGRVPGLRGPGFCDGCRVDLHKNICAPFLSNVPTYIGSIFIDDANSAASNYKVVEILLIDEHYVLI